MFTPAGRRRSVRAVRSEGRTIGGALQDRYVGGSFFTIKSIFFLMGWTDTNGVGGKTLELSFKSRFCRFARFQFVAETQRFCNMDRMSITTILLGAQDVGGR